MISIKSYAKINLVLNVSGKREDGYHLLDSVVLPLELHDSILLSRIKNGYETYVTIDDFSQGAIKYNIASLAIDMLRAKKGFNDKLRVYIHKNIPMKAGLGGGSSNAAFTLKGVDKFLKLHVDEKELFEISQTLGADVPFFINCQPSRMQGIGEVLTPIKVKNNYFVLIVKPKDGLSTKTVFEKSDEMKLKTYDIDKTIKALEDGDDDLLAESFGNALEDPAVELLPEISKIKQFLQGYGLKIVGMTGSGSALYAMSVDQKLLKKIASELEDTYQVILTKVKK